MCWKWGKLDSPQNSSNRSKTTEIYLSNHQLFIQIWQLFPCIITFFVKSWIFLKFAFFLHIFIKNCWIFLTHFWNGCFLSNLLDFHVFKEKWFCFSWNLQFFVFSSKFPEISNYFEILNFLEICWFFMFFGKCWTFSWNLRNLRVVILDPHPRRCFLAL